MSTRKKPDRHSRHIQARLRLDLATEKEAVETYDWLKSPSEDGSDSQWTDRLILKEGLLALRKKLDKGYKPVLVETEITLTTEMRRTLKLIMEQVQLLQSIDLTAVRHAPNWDEQKYQDTATKLNKSVSNLFGESKTYYDDEDD
jgi:hypothetical protein